MLEETVSGQKCVDQTWKTEDVPSLAGKRAMEVSSIH